jgi:uncharacterized hydantoinase/oxoprolinase family protein
LPAEPTIGWDLGGATSAARLGPSGRVERVVEVPCALWRGLAELERALEGAESALGPAPVHAVTMTGEMVDFFPTRADGVAAPGRGDAQAVRGSRTSILRRSARAGAGRGSGE